MLCKRTSDNRITLPQNVVDSFDNCEYYELEALEDRIVLIPVSQPPIKQKKNLDSIREKISALGITDDDIEESIKWARSK